MKTLNKYSRVKANYPNVHVRLRIVRKDIAVGEFDSPVS